MNTFLRVTFKRLYPKNTVSIEATFLQNLVRTNTNCPYMFRRACSLKYFLSDKLLFFNKAERYFLAKNDDIEISNLEPFQNK